MSAVGPGRRVPVLVTGSHRSGSTWIGRMLAAADELHYVQEPFNIVARQRWLSPRPTRQFLYVHDGNSGEWERPYERILQLRYPLRDHLRTRPDMSTAKRMVRIAADARRAARRGAAPLVKDPIALFSTPWLRRRFDMTTVILVRDPVAFVGSLKARGWTFDFRHWAEQPELMRDVLAEHSDEIRALAAGSSDVVEQGIVQWNAMYRAADRFRRADPDIIIVHYETIARNPLVEVEGLYRRLGLRYGAPQRAVVEALSTASGQGSSPIDVRRTSTDALTTWQQRLTDEEIARVREATMAVASLVAPPG